VPSGQSYPTRTFILRGLKGTCIGLRSVRSLAPKGSELCRLHHSLPLRVKPTTGLGDARHRIPYAILARMELERSPAPTPRFYCDNNVHRLGRSLRMLGYDSLYFGAGPDDELRELREQTGRILLTRDSDFDGEGNTLVLSSDQYLTQLKTVVRKLELDVTSHRYSLCLACNVRIESTDSARHADSVPEWVVREDHPLWHCPACLKLYWAGSHLDRMDERFKRLFS
jgi:uncharacterized protein with PIN domain